MANRIPVERRIYDNYDLDEIYPDEMIREILDLEDDEELDDEDAWNWRYTQTEFDWDDALCELKKFFEGKTVGFFGEVGRWNGVCRGGKIGDFEKILYDAISDCDYIKIYDENGHLHLTCSHHDGTNHFEIKIITENGEKYNDNWEYSGWYDKRTQAEVYDQIYKRYSLLPHYCHKQYGCKKVEYEKPTKKAIVNALNNQAKSFYSA